MFDVIVEFNAPAKASATVQELAEDAILDAAWNDLKNPEINSDWRSSYGDLKGVIRESSFLEEDWQELLTSKGQYQLSDYR
jgi:hypothetical protein